MDQVFEIFSKASIFVPVMIALAKLAQMIVLPRKWTPIWNLVVGIIIAIVYVCPTDLRISIMVGIMLGLAASGLYSGVKNTTQAMKARQ